jgi:hypothetical protein
LHPRDKWVVNNSTTELATIHSLGKPKPRTQSILARHDCPGKGDGTLFKRLLERFRSL